MGRLPTTAQPPRRLLAQDEADTEVGGLHENTPTTAVFDVQGRTVRVQELLDVSTELTTLASLDVQGFPEVLTDPRGVAIHQQRGDMLGRLLYEDSADAGEAWTLLDVAGQPVRQWKSGGLSLRWRYDALRRIHTANGGRQSPAAV